MEHLATLAEISVALAGFSSIIVVFRRAGSDGAWQPEDVFRLRMMLQYSLAAAAFAVMPGALLGLGVTAEVLWPSLSALLAIYLAVDLAYRSRAVRRLPRRSLNPILALVLPVGNATVMISQALNAIGWVASPGAGTYLFGATWLTITAGIMFYRLITAPLAPDQ